MKLETKTGFHKKLIATFRVEAAEHLQTMSSGMIELEGAPAAETHARIIETIFRAAHSLKGAARAVNLTEIETICHVLESVFAALTRQELGLSLELLDTLHQAVDNLHVFLSCATDEQGTSEMPHIAPLIRSLEGVLKGDPLPPKSIGPQKIQEDNRVSSRPEAGRPYEEAPGLQPMSLQKCGLTETIRIPTARLDALLLQTEGLISAKLAANQRAAELCEIITAFATWKRKWNSVYGQVRTVRQWFENPGRDDPVKSNGQLTKLFEFLDWSSAFIKSQESNLALLAKSTDQDQRSLSALVDHLLEGTKQVRMMPCSSLLEVFPKIVRELSRDQGKEVKLVIQREEIEVDRQILEEMKDALMHLVRNCIDHGIEKPEERVRKGKTPRGTLTIAISPKDGNKVEILVSDDGAGIDAAKVRDTAQEIQVISREEAAQMSERESLLLIFQSGVSTSPLITDISGRGLGLAIVRERVEKLGGIISVDSQPHNGATFRTVLPLTLATFRGVFVRAAEHLFVLPTANVERVMRVSKTDVQTVEGRDTIQIDGHIVSLLRLADVLELPGTSTPEVASDKIQVVVLGSAEKRIAFLVDEVVNEQEVLVKSLGKQLSRVRNVAGATVTGTGSVAPILKVADLMQSALQASAVPIATDVSARTLEAKRKTILIAEDSITSRMLLKNILEPAGYAVKTAVDGMDALAIMGAEDFDLLISDVDMPRMNGFDLTAKIRADKRLAELPVVLVTALGSREDRERGLEVGANAYMVKSNFDQSDLLEIVRRLI